VWILDPISIATSGYIGIGPGATDYCPLPLAIGSHGYIRFEVDAEIGDGGHAAGHGAVIHERIPAKRNLTRIASLAAIAIHEFYDG
jgi:hypothetical protein